MNVISKAGLLDLLKGKSKDVQAEVLAWYRVARRSTWAGFAELRRQFPDVDLVDGLLVFNIRQNRYRLIVVPVFRHHRLYVKALLSHKEYEKGAWRTRWLH